MHHIAADGWSQTILVNELAQSYEAHLKGRTPLLPELPVQYSDYARWQRDLLQGSVLESQLSYWQDQLGANLPTLDLPADYPRPAIQTFEGAHETRQLDADLSHSLKGRSEMNSGFVLAFGNWNVKIGKSFLVKTQICGPESELIFQLRIYCWRVAIASVQNQ